MPEYTLNQASEVTRPEVATVGGQPQASIARNTIWNFAGQIAPMFLAAFAIPLLVHRLGVDRFGILSLVWILVGYFSLFDFGIGRAITKLLAETIAIADWEHAAGLVWAATFSMVLVGMIFGGALLALAPWLSQSVLKIPPYLRSETVRSLPWLAIAVPFVTVSCGFKGMLEARQNFASVNTLRAAFGIFNYLGPLAILPFSHSLVPIVSTQAAARMINCGLYFWACKRSMPGLWSTLRWDRKAVRALYGFGSWLTVSNILSPLMVYLDRFLIGSLVSISSVAFYSAPFDAVSKLWLVPTALEGVLFPAFSQARALNNGQRVGSLYQRSIAISLAILFPVVLGIVLFAPEGLRLWLGESFATRSAAVLQILAIGIFTNSLAHMPYSLLQASGRPDLTAKLHFAEVPFYLGLLYCGVRMRGIEGAALAWTFRLSIEAAILFFIFRKLITPRLWITVAAGLAVLIVAPAVTTDSFKVIFFAASIGTFIFVMWQWTLDDPFRVRLREWLKSVPILHRASA